MKLSEKLERVPRGNTVHGVNRAIIEYLLTLNTDFDRAALLDVPCGKGVFLDAFRDFFPDAKSVGADIDPPYGESKHQFFKIDARQLSRIQTDERFKIVTCISGVTEFDNTQLFLEQVRELLDRDGILLVTNDNIFSARNRILYFLFGRFRQTHLFMPDDEPTWKIIPLQNLIRILYEAGFEASEVKYVPAKVSEWLWLPAAALFYVFQLIYFIFAETGTAFSSKSSLYPFTALISRHYIVACHMRCQANRIN
jgi:Methylase involved in ubiquinone/menaquinone biosynthesis